LQEVPALRLNPKDEAVRRWWWSSILLSYHWWQKFKHSIEDLRREKERSQREAEELRAKEKYCEVLEADAKMASAFAAQARENGERSGAEQARVDAAEVRELVRQAWADSAASREALNKGRTEAAIQASRAKAAQSELKREATQLRRYHQELLKMNEELKEEYEKKIAELQSEAKSPVPVAAVQQSAKNENLWLRRQIEQLQVQLSEVQGKLEREVKAHRESQEYFNQELRPLQDEVVKLRLENAVLKPSSVSGGDPAKKFKFKGKMPGGKR
jgi:hypothetical protein